MSMDYRLRKLAEYVRGWMNYFGISEYYRPIPEIDPWLRTEDSTVLLETVALSSNQGAMSSSNWEYRVQSGFRVHEQQRSLADVPFTCHSDRPDQPMAEGSGDLCLSKNCG